MGFAPKGISRLSELEIDTNKDWGTYGIDSLGYIIIEDGAGHYLKLSVLTTAQRDGLTEVTGMIIWNSTTGQAERYDGADWGPMGISGVSVRKNTRMPVIGTRPQLNLIEGVGISILAEDNVPDDEIDLTFSSTTPEKFIVLVPGDAALPTANPAAKAAVDGTNFAYDVLDFDPDTEESCNWEYYLSPDYKDENIIVDIFWITTDVDTGHDAQFGFSVLGREHDETWDAALGSEQIVTSPNPGAGKVCRSRVSTFAPGWAAGDVVLFKLARKAAEVADTVDQDVRVLKVVARYTASFAQSFYPITPVDLSHDGWLNNVWNTVDVSAYVPVGATGVILHLVNQSGGTIGCNLRKKGSTDARNYGIRAGGHAWAMIGVDENRQFEIFSGFSVDFHLYLIGYTASGVIFFDNAYNKSLGAAGAWTDIDLSSECPGAIGIIIEVINTSGAQLYGYNFRKKGSADNRINFFVEDKLYKGNVTWAVIGCNGSQVIEGIIQNLAVDFYVVGYITTGAVFHTNAIERSPSTYNVWEDQTVAGAKAIIGFFELSKYTPTYFAGLEKNGTDEADRTYAYASKGWGITELDANRKLINKSAQIATEIAIRFWETGYATSAD